MSPEPRPFADHFSRQAPDYAVHRPGYPDELFAFLAACCPGHDRAWDCGTGNGQAALGLARHFAAVHAADPSEAQLKEARAHPRVTYHQTNEAASGLPSASVDLVTAAQAFHWFDPGAFFAEARRVARPRGVVAIWCYGLPTSAAQVDPLLRHFHDVTVGPDWPAGRELVVELYRGVAFPFDEIAAPPFAIERSLDLTALAAYVRTWSVVQRYQERTGRDPVGELVAALRPVWGGDAVARRVAWPIGLRVGRVTD